ncbi:MAG TPA: hypothetical protein DEA62_01025 [Coxiellaceae bacterium]|nr:MAG: hypothetical protein A2V89_00680 [Gammaproteobacteria bacterium RBG_16_37_9]HBS51563.1 hypothetical protein [Coxiellaceae bacterium]HBY56116.1 hypothetical protein [Coxiellaceae bacterium]
MNMRVIIVAFVCCLLSPSYVGAVSADLDKIVAVVNSDVITQSELDKKTVMIKKQLSNAKTPVLRQQVLDSIINNLLQLQLAKRSGMQVSDVELDGIIANIAKSNGLTVSQLKQSVQEREGISINDFRNQIREQVLISRVQQQSLGRDIVVSDKEVATVLHNPPKVDNTQAQYHVVDILFETSDDTSKDKLEKITKVAKQAATKLQRGISVDKVVKESQGNFDAQIIQNNDLGWRKINELPTLFAKEITKMNINQVVGPLQAPNGVHLLKLLGMNSSSSQSTKITAEQAREIIYQRKLVEKIKPWLEGLRKAAYVKIIK